MTELKIIYQNLCDIRPYSRNARLHNDKHVCQIANSITEFDFTNPLLVDEDNVLLAGHGRLLAAKKLGLDSVPCVRIDYLTDAQKRAYRITDNQLTINGDWDRDLLGLELKDLSDLDFNLDVIGFETAELDVLIQGLGDDFVEHDHADDMPDVDNGHIVSRPGDLWRLGQHLIYCGDALKCESFEKLMSDGLLAQMVFADAPYNVPVDGHVCGAGRVHHDEFAMASGEMSREQFTQFLRTAFTNLRDWSVDGSLHYLCMDWRHIIEITAACDDVYTEMKNLCVWNKASGGMGSLYRSKHELIFVYKNGRAPHINNVELGANGRYRTNVWDYPGVNSFGENRDDLKLHPTVKNVQMVADAIMDVTNRGDVVLDSFLGSGTTLLACERVGRVCRGIEIEPKYVDVAILRWQKLTGKNAVNVDLERTYNELLMGARNE